jgi:hypothetical protein
MSYLFLLAFVISPYYEALFSTLLPTKNNRKKWDASYEKQDMSNP